MASFPRWKKAAGLKSNFLISDVGSRQSWFPDFPKVGFPISGLVFFWSSSEIKKFDFMVWGADRVSG